MSQVGFGYCLPRVAASLQPKEPDVGYYTVTERPDPGCVPWNADEARRADMPAPRFPVPGKAVPREYAEEGVDTIKGDLAQALSRPLQTLQTEQGPVALAYGPSPDMTWRPSVALLNALPYRDTRLTAISDRYFDH